MKYLIHSHYGLYLKNHPSNQHWTSDILQAKQFDSMTTANICAIMDVGIGTEEYDVEHYNEPQVEGNNKDTDSVVSSRRSYFDIQRGPFSLLQFPAIR